RRPDHLVQIAELAEGQCLGRRHHRHALRDADAVTQARRGEDDMNASSRRIAMLAIAALGWTAQAQAESVKVGLSKLISYPGVPTAIQRGYFKEQNPDAQMVFFDSAQPISVGVASGDIDFGVSGLSAGFYSLASQGQLKIIAASAGEAPGFYNLTFVASNKAYDGGFKSVKDLPGHDVAITQLGT